jgi:pimeloyl-ACP methyl ester carboxylesterase
MDIILVPGLWLDASSWDDVTPALERAGHAVQPLTMPGVGAPASESADIGIADWVSAVVDRIDAAPGLVVLVGHSGGGNVVYGAADARPERVARIIFVDTFPPGDGGSIWEFPIVDGVIPFPGWDFFDEPEIADLDEATRERAAARTRNGLR